MIPERSSAQGYSPWFEPPTTAFISQARADGFEARQEWVTWEWLGPGVFGAEAGARQAFGVTIEDLSPRQAVLLAAVLPNPKWRSAADPGLTVSRRADWILRQIDQLGGPGYLEDI